MSYETGISWASSTWNPIIGCKKYSAGCENCYATKFAYRLSKMGVDDYKHIITSDAQWTGHTMFRHQHIAQPLSWNNPRRVFVGSMTDIFHEDVSYNQLNIVMRMIWECRHLHTFILCTKRAERMQQYFKKLNLSETGQWPWPHVVLMVTAENQREATRRLPLLCNTPAASRGVSCEPLLEQVNLLPWLGRLSWVIAGCESGTGRRKAYTEWFRLIKDQCRITGTSFFLKQMEIDGKVIKTPNLDGQQWVAYPQINMCTTIPEKKKK